MYLIPVSIHDSSIEGKGYFAASNIPAGTIAYVYGSEDIRYSREQFESMSLHEQNHLMDKGVEDEYGNWVETKSGPYTNHSCDANILPLHINGNYVDIVVRDIAKGEEVTIDYSLFYSSTQWSMKCKCGTTPCRGTVGFGIPIDSRVTDGWRTKLEYAVTRMKLVPQSLFQSHDPLVKELQDRLLQKTSTTLGTYIKFSLLSKSL